MKIPALLEILRAAGLGLVLSSLLAAFVGWKKAAILENKLDEIFAEAKANGGSILLQLSD